MIKDPEYKLQWIGIAPTDIVSIHYESTYQVQRALDWLAPYKCKRFLAINPATPIYVLEEVLDYIDGINLLMVNPGFAGQKIVPSTLKKAARIQKFLKDRGREDKNHNTFYTRVGIVVAALFATSFYSVFLQFFINVGLFSDKYTRYLGGSSGFSINPILIRLPFIILILVIYKQFCNYQSAKYQSLEKYNTDFLIIMLIIEMLTVNAPP